MIRYRLIVLRLRNLVREDAKKLAGKIAMQKKMSNRDNQKARILLSNVHRRVLMRVLELEEEQPNLISRSGKPVPVLYRTL